LAKAALETGNTFRREAFTYSTVQAEELIELADRKNLKIMVTTPFFHRRSEKNSSIGGTRAHLEISTTTIRCDEFGAFFSMT